MHSIINCDTEVMLFLIVRAYGAVVPAVAPNVDNVVEPLIFHTGVPLMLLITFVVAPDIYSSGVITKNGEVVQFGV